MVWVAGELYFGVTFSEEHDPHDCHLHLCIFLALDGTSLASMA